MFVIIIFLFIDSPFPFFLSCTLVVYYVQSQLPRSLIKKEKKNKMIWLVNKQNDE